MTTSKEKAVELMSDLRVRTVRGLPRHWRRIAQLMESIPAAGPVDRHVAATLRGCAWDLDDVLRRTSGR
jgi:hypothetical protein